MAYLEMNDVSVGFGPSSNRTNVLESINLHVEQNEFVAIIGFSGSGKSTLISLLAGLLPPDTGEIRLHGERIKGPTPNKGVVFQNYSLLPWLSVYGNIELSVKKVFPQYTKVERREHVERYIEMVNLTPAIEKKPGELSGGMRQRVSLARTLAMQPEILLLDEPLSALDAITRASLQDEIIRLWEEDKRTVVMITNDIDEAVLMADRIVPLTMGPGATLARHFDVDLQRPRDRTTLNVNPVFRSLKTEITDFMIGLNHERKQMRSENRVEMPNITPIDFTAA